MHGNIFAEVSIVIAVAAAVSLIMHLLRQPLIVGHIFAGILLGPTILNFIKSSEPIELMGSFGIALLLFLVGLGLNPKVIKEVGRVSLLTGLGQVVFTVLLGLAVTTLYGYGLVAGLYIAVALAFSSTIIILKLLTDKKEHNKLYGKISIGFLLVQDIIATIALVVASTSAKGTGLGVGDIVFLLLKAGIIIALVVAFTHFVIRPMNSVLARSQELLFLFAVAWGFCIATIFYQFGFSLEVGALVAGVALSTMHYAQEIGSRLRPLRDFFIVVFFISLGANLNFGNAAALWPQVVAFSILVLVGNPLVVMIIMGMLGYTKKTGFKAGLAVAQISEFSLIFILLGLKNGQISEDVVSLVTIVGIITIAISAYMITYSEKIYAALEKYLGVFERKATRAENDHMPSYQCVLLGYREGGSEYVKAFSKISKHFIVIDYNPETIEELEKKNIPNLYGDITDPELLDEIDLSKVKLVVSHASDSATNRFVVEYMENINPSAVVICRADNAHDAAELYGLGASYVTLPHYIGSEQISSFIRRNGFRKTEYSKYREKQIAQLTQYYNAEEDSLAA